MYNHNSHPPKGTSELFNSRIKSPSIIESLCCFSSSKLKVMHVFKYPEESGTICQQPQFYYSLLTLLNVNCQHEGENLCNLSLILCAIWCPDTSVVFLLT
ncbi:hypothetical protein KIL84_022866 [Mauremys mutica]|uniref:Uncharacterized protein n=1 Tax=Mauremys mutica TaxID=74926 RepID=A0A9D3WNX5_9SAUR|nr:hypothetical protein KIL84_022866 [Mauremys mutica]